MNWNKLGGIGLAALLALATGCFRNPVSEMELEIPAMRTATGERLVKEAVASLGMNEQDGAIRSVRTDAVQRKAWVVFDNVRLGRRNVEVAVRHAGFAVNDLPAVEEARAKLPPECRGDE